MIPCCSTLRSFDVVIEQISPVASKSSTNRVFPADRQCLSEYNPQSPEEMQLSLLKSRTIAGDNCRVVDDFAVKHGFSGQPCWYTREQQDFAARRSDLSTTSYGTFPHISPQSIGKTTDFPINTSNWQGMFQLVIFDDRRVIRWNWRFLAVSGEVFSSISDPLCQGSGGSEEGGSWCRRSEAGRGEWWDCRRCSSIFLDGWPSSFRDQKFSHWGQWAMSI